MRKIISTLSFFILILSALLLTDVINDTYIILFLGLLNDSADITTANIQKLFDAFVKKDWASIGSISVRFMYYGLYVYFLRCLVYFFAVVTVILWARPYLTKIFIALKHPEDLTVDELTPLPVEKRRAYIVDAMRARAGRKRVESYAFLMMALAALVLSIGFVSRGEFAQRPEVLGYDETSLSATLDRAITQVENAQLSLDSRLSDLRAVDGEVRTLVEENRVAPKGKAGPLNAKAPSDISEYLKRPSYIAGLQYLNSPTIATDIVSIGKAQIDLIGNQAKIETAQAAIYSIAGKIAAVIIILALVRTLVELYRRGHDQATQYDGIADAIQLGQKDISENIGELRAALTPQGSSGNFIKVPKSIFREFIKSIAEFRGTARDAGA